MSVADELTTLRENISSAYNEIENKGGTIPTNKNTANLASSIFSISGGGGGVSDEDPVQFWDYDGTLLYSYTTQEFLALSEMPALAQHEGLTPEGWNWSFEGAQDYVNKYGACIIGEVYETEDEKTHIFLDLPNLHYNTFTVGVSLSGTSPEFIIDWGDGTTNTLTGTGNKSQSHTYEVAGNYEITFDCNVGALYAPNSLIQTSGGGTYSYDVIGIYVGKRCSYHHGDFGQFPDLEFMTIPSTYHNNSQETGSNTTDSYLSFKAAMKAFIMPSGEYQICQASIELYSRAIICLPEICRSTIASNSQRWPFNGQKIVTVPENATIYMARLPMKKLILGSGAQLITSGSQQNYGILEDVHANGCLLSSATNSGQYAFARCEYLKNVDFGNNSVQTTIYSHMFEQCQSLKNIKLPSSITTIQQYAFSGCYLLHTLDLTDCSTMVTLVNTNAIPTRTNVLVPQSLLADYLADSVWSTISDQIVGIE